LMLLEESFSTKDSHYLYKYTILSVKNAYYLD